MPVFGQRGIVNVQHITRSVKFRTNGVYNGSGDLNRIECALIVNAVAKFGNEDPAADANVATVAKKGGEFVLGSVARWKAAARLNSLADGRYTLGVRPHHVTPKRAGGRTAV